MEKASFQNGLTSSSSSSFKSRRDHVDSPYLTPPIALTGLNVRVRREVSFPPSLLDERDGFCCMGLYTVGVIECSAHKFSAVSGEMGLRFFFFLRVACVDATKCIPMNGHWAIYLTRDAKRERRKEEGK